MNRLQFDEELVLAYNAELAKAKTTISEATELANPDENKFIPNTDDNDLRDAMIAMSNLTRIINKLKVVETESQYT